jgi:nucleotide-binding universal stress UspA family protein
MEISMYRNIMVPLDGSSFSRDAMLAGLRIASRSGATLRLVKVAVAPAIPGTPEGLAPSAEPAKDKHALELSSLYAAAAECRAHANIQVVASLEHGPVVEALTGYAHRNDVDLIVMRSHGRGGIKRVWFGSVADRLIRETGLPVLIVRPPSVATALEGGTNINRILVPLDGSELAERALSPAIRLASVDEASITLLRVVTAWKQREPGVLESHLGPASAAEVAEAQRYLDSVMAWRSEPSLRIGTRVVISSDPAMSILDVAREIEADAITLATRGRGALRRAASGSVSDRVMRESEVSTIVLHPEMESGVPAEPRHHLAGVVV